jgi:hypothetical protein
MRHNYTQKSHHVLMEQSRIDTVQMASQHSMQLKASLLVMQHTYITQF